jgi:hypothetical protein
VKLNAELSGGRRISATALPGHSAWPKESHRPSAGHRLSLSIVPAIAEMEGADADLVAIPAVAADSRLTGYQPYRVARAELMAKVGANYDACHAYEIATGLESDAAVRRILQRCQSALMW